MKLYAAIGLAVVAVALGLTLLSNRGARIIMQGSIQKVRLQKIDEANTVAVVEFRLNNPSDYPFTVKNAQLVLEDAKGERIEGDVFRQTDLGRFFDFYQGTLGPRYNPSVYVGDKIGSKQGGDRMIAASFPRDEAALGARKRLVIRLEAVNGIVPTEIAETARR
jgi:hypothetical protein